MNNTIAYAHCNGETVRVKPQGYIQLGDFGMLAPVPAKVERVVYACGGGKPTVYGYMIGFCACGGSHFVERAIVRPDHASNHKCDARCLNATGKKCECSCQGKNHGGN